MKPKIWNIRTSKQLRAAWLKHKAGDVFNIALGEYSIDCPAS